MDGDDSFDNYADKIDGWKKEEYHMDEFSNTARFYTPIQGHTYILVRRN